MKRTEIDEKYKWDLTILFANEVAFDCAFKEMEAFIPKLKKFEGKLNKKEELFNFLKLQKEFNILVSKIELYVSLQSAIDISDIRFIEKKERFESFSVKANQELIFAKTEPSKFSKQYFEELYNDSRFKNNDRMFEYIQKNQKHVLTEKEERLLAGMGNFCNFHSTFSILDTKEIKFDPVTINGKSTELNHDTFSIFLKNKNQNIRKQAFENYHNAFGKFNMTLTSLLLNDIKSTVFDAREHKFDSAIERAFFNEEVNRNVYKTLIDSVHSHFFQLQKYMLARKNALNIDKNYYYDLSVPIFETKKFNMDFDDAFELVKESLFVLGNDYVDRLEFMRKNRMIDVYPSENKRGGAFETSDSNGLQFVLLNHNKQFYSASVIAHELGHAMHSYFSEKNQPYEKNDYCIFIAEVASTVNEMLLKLHILENAKDVKMKKMIAENILNDFRCTVFRQTMFSEFEAKIYDRVENNIPVTYDTLNFEYEKLLKEYHGKTVVFPSCSKFEWSRIPHFYYNFYVYKYATGMLASVLIAKKLKTEKNYKEKYIKFLSSGSSANPIELLKIADIDLENKDTFKMAFDFMDEMIDTFKGD